MSTHPKQVNTSCNIWNKTVSLSIGTHFFPSHLIFPCDTPAPEEMKKIKIHNIESNNNEKGLVPIVGTTQFQVQG